MFESSALLAVVIAAATITGALGVGMKLLNKLPFALQQSVNLDGITKTFQYLTRPQFLIPDIELDNLNQLDIRVLRSKGIKCIVFDKDNTLTHTYKDEIHPSIRAVVDTIKLEFTADCVAILSNSVGSCDDKDFRGATSTEKSLGMSVIRHMRKKPGCVREVAEHFKARTGKEVVLSEIAVIGDRLLTDVLFANDCGMLSVLVAPLSVVHDHPVAVVIRSLERRLLLPIFKLMRHLLGRATGEASGK